MLKKKRFNNFQVVSSTNVQSPNFDIETNQDRYNDRFTIIPYEGQLKILLKKIRKQLESIPSEENCSEKMRSLREIDNLLKKYQNNEQVVNFLMTLYIDEFQKIQKSPEDWLIIKSFLAQKIEGFASLVSSDRISEFALLCLEFAQKEPDGKVQRRLVLILKKLFQRNEKIFEDQELKQRLINQLSKIVRGERSQDLDGKFAALYFLLELIENDSEKKDSFLELFMIELNRDPSLIGIYISFLKNIASNNFSGPLINTLIRKTLEICKSQEVTFEENHVDILEFLSECFNLPDCKELRLDIYRFYCESTRSLVLDIKLKAGKMIGLVNDIPLSHINQALTKEEFDNYRRKKKSKKEDIQSSDLSLTSENSKEFILDRISGTFIHLLEDEHSEIRLAAIHSIGSLAQRYPQFGLEARDLLLHMLHDDEDKVRIAALEITSQILKEINLRDFEKDVLLFNMREDVFLLRISIYKLLSCIKCSSLNTFTQIFNALLSNLTTRSMDKSFIFQSLHSMILNNFEVCYEYIQNFLEEIKFNIQEPDWKGSEHIGKMILMATMSFKYPDLIELFPHYYQKHVEFLKDVYPSYFVAQSSQNKDISIKMKYFDQKKISNDENCKIEAIVAKEILSIISKRMDSYASHAALKKLKSDVLRIKISEDVKSIENLINVLVVFFDIQNDSKDSYSMEILASTWSDEYLFDIFVSINGIEEVHHRTESLKAMSLSLRIFFLLFSLWKILQTGINHQVFHQRKIIETSMLIMRLIRGHTNFKSKAILSSLINSPTQILKVDILQEYAAILMEDITNFALPHIEDLNLSSKSKSRANITNPTTNLEDALEMNSQLFIKFTVEADLFNIDDIDKICIVVESLNGKSAYFKLSKNDIIINEEKAGSLKIQTNIHLDYGYWNRPAKIKFYLGHILNQESLEVMNMLEEHVFVEKIKLNTNKKLVRISNEVELYIKPIKPYS